MKQKIFEVGKKAYTFNQARYEEDMGRCVITAVSERYITDDIGNKFTVSSDDRDYLTAEGNRTLRLYVSEKEALGFGTGVRLQAVTLAVCFFLSKKSLNPMLSDILLARAY